MQTTYSLSQKISLPQKNLFLAYESQCTLSFTHENEKDKQLSFLARLITRFDKRFSTFVHIKEVIKYSCLNYNKVCLDNYKVEVTNSYLDRANLVSSNNETLETEVVRMKQLLTNINLPLYLIEKYYLKNLVTKKSTYPNYGKTRNN